MPLPTRTKAELLSAAKQARERAYAPYSHYAVGAAIVASSGKVYTGCNVENASYGLTVCAERNAIFTAVGAGEKHIEAVAVVTDAAAPGTPCGACRQVIQEFATGPDLVVLLANLAGQERELTLAQLFPEPFGL
jgi:cytidine deaminase